MISNSNKPKVGITRPLNYRAKMKAAQADDGFMLATVKINMFGVEFTRRVGASEAEVFNQQVLTLAGKAVQMKVDYDLFD